MCKDELIHNISIIMYPCNFNDFIDVDILYGVDSVELNKHPVAVSIYN